MKRGKNMQGDQVQNDAYDEAIPVETDDEELSTPASSQPSSPAASKPSPAGGGKSSPAKQGGGGGDNGSESGDSSSSEEGSTSSDTSGGGMQNSGGDASMPAGAYNPDDFSGMRVSSEIEELFQYITRYKPHTIELDSSMKPFIPELIPSIGEVDAFLKMPRPDGEQNILGTTCLDEPTMNPSDPSILDLQLRSVCKHQDLQPMEVRSIENAEKNPKEIENWVKRINELNRGKPAATVQYSRRMPDIEQLMQVWPAEFEEYLQQNALPDMTDLDLDLPAYIRIMASILDIPVNQQLTETLHVMFTLYSEFKSNQHFANNNNANNFNDPYSFGGEPFPTAAGATGAQVMSVFGGPTTESMAPSRAPSPVGQSQNKMRIG